ncbi:MAG: hypothetical protein CXT70_05020 [Methanobacteriota archaeon]|nr:MAG: hypothetical protein CXT70_05020 [Euryarchaeota archaeon]
MLPLCLVAFLYASVGHGGASGYLAILSLTAYSSQDSAWLKQHAWSLNLLVAGLAFIAYRRSGYFSWKLTLPFIITSIPAAMMGGYLKVDHGIYDVLLSITLIFAAWRLLAIKGKDSEALLVAPPPYHIAAVIGLGIGLLSGVVGVGGGIFLSPIILLFGWGDAKTTAGVAAAFVWLNSAAGLVGNAISGQLVLEAGVLLPFAIAVSIGGFFGSKMGAEGLSQQTVRRLLVAVLLLAALKRVVELIV